MGVQFGFAGFEVDQQSAIWESTLLMPRVSPWYIDVHDQYWTPDVYAVDAFDALRQGDRNAVPVGVLFVAIEDRRNNSIIAMVTIQRSPVHGDDPLIERSYEPRA